MEKREGGQRVYVNGFFFFWEMYRDGCLIEEESPIFKFKQWG